jgi:UPF0271 protein
MRISIPINADLGEGLGTDAQLMPFLTACNIACTGHAGTVATMTQTTKLAKHFGVAIGAHPSFPDRENFGRKPLSIPPKELTKSILSQITSLLDICDQLEVKMQHIKPHGALYNLAAKDKDIAYAVLEAIDSLPKKLQVYTLPNSMLSQLAATNFEVVHEAFLDRAYEPDGSLVARSKNGAVLVNANQIWEQCRALFFDKQVKVANGKYIPLVAQTFCVHGDTPHILEALQFVSTQLKKPHYD